ncbi:MAG TPA: hypothetical protein VFJ16_19535 [Longimicrobium sp.]|nr:hypothetical protein [Longimicrobium sp.]
MSRELPHDLKIFSADASSPAPSALAEPDPACPDCVTFVAGPPGTPEFGAAWLPDEASATFDEDGTMDGESPLARLFAPNAPLSVAWEEVANPGPAPSPADEEAMEAYARAYATARFARRVLEGDPHAWIEALASYRERMRLPLPVRSTLRAQEDGSLRAAIELPGPGAIPKRRGETLAARRARYDDLCSGILLAFACDAFRVLPPAADSLYLVGYRREADPATGHPRHAILMRLATDRASLGALDLSRATPSAAFEYLGGAARKTKSELQPLAYETEFSRVM